jgi:hypothetical protein
MTSPTIEFHVVSSSRSFRLIHSTAKFIRFRVWERAHSTTLDADWFTTAWKLAPAARDAIFSHCAGRALDWGGGTACLIIHAKPGAAPELQQFLKQILANPVSWLRWNREQQEFLPLPILEAAA